MLCSKYNHSHFPEKETDSGRLRNQCFVNELVNIKQTQEFAPKSIFPQFCAFPIYHCASSHVRLQKKEELEFSCKRVNSVPRDGPCRNYIPRGLEAKGCIWMLS